MSNLAILLSAEAGWAPPTLHDFLYKICTRCSSNPMYSGGHWFGVVNGVSRVYERGLVLIWRKTRQARKPFK